MSVPNVGTPLLSESRQSASHLVWKLALPVVGEQFLTMLVGWSDTILTGQILRDDPYLAAIAADSYLLWLLESFAVLIQAGALAIVARHVGAGETSDANRIIVQSLLLSAGLGIILGVVTWLLADQFVRWMQLIGFAHALATTYLKIVALSCPCMTVLLVGTTCLRAAGYTVAGLWVMGAVNVINVAFSWSLTIGVRPLPGLGWPGIAVGTALSFLVGALVTLGILWRGYGTIRIPREVPTLSLVSSRRILRIGVPGAVNSLAVVLGHIWYVSINGRLGNVALAAHVVAIRCESVSWLTAEAFAVATAALVGQALGARRPDLARQYGWTALRIGVLCLCLMGVGFFFGAEWLFAIFIGPEQSDVFSQGVPVLRLVSFSMPALAACIILTGALRGAGDTRWPLLYSILGLVGVRIPLSYLLALGPMQLGLIGAWVAMLVDLYVRGLAACGRFLMSGWMRIRV